MTSTISPQLRWQRTHKRKYKAYQKAYYRRIAEFKKHWYQRNKERLLALSKARYKEKKKLALVKVFGDQVKKELV